MADKSQSFRDVIVWQKAHAFTWELYRATEGFPKHEHFALTSQLRRVLQGYINGMPPDSL